MQEQAMALESLACIHDSGVLLGSAQLPHILVQRTQVRSDMSCMYPDIVYF
jgi:hypothetical protein